MLIAVLTRSFSDEGRVMYPMSKQQSLGVVLLLCLFKRIIIVGFSLGPLTRLVSGWLLATLAVGVWALCHGVGLKSVRREMVTPTTFVLLLHPSETLSYIQVLFRLTGFIAGSEWWLLFSSYSLWVSSSTSFSGVKLPLDYQLSFFTFNDISSSIFTSRVSASGHGVASITAVVSTAWKESLDLFGQQL